jgi:hypothetical protein
MKKLFTLWVACALSAFSTTTEGSDLNRQLNDTPTLGSEILRGMNAATNCTMSTSATLLACAVESITANRQKLVESAPFELGISFGCWFYLGAQMPVLERYSKTMKVAATKLKQARAGRESCFQMWYDIEDRLGLTDRQLVTASFEELDGSEVRLLAEMNRWKSSAKVIKRVSNHHSISH